MRRRTPWLLLALAWMLAGCATTGSRRADASPPRYRSADELVQCYPGECVEAELRFRHWADAAHFRGRMPYHCDPGSELHTRPDPSIERVILVVHGVVGESPESMARLAVPPGLMQFRNVVNALRQAQKRDRQLAGQHIAILAPTFQRTEEWQPYTDEDPRNWTWAGNSYHLGSMSEYREATSGIVKADAVSSFDVMDEFLRAAVVKFPNAKDFVVVGHSAGAQFVHRYVWMGVGVHEQLAAAGIRVRYVPANPGGYAFPILQRKLPPGRDTVPKGEGRGDTHDWRWVVPRRCEEWDRWGWGLSGLADATSDRLVRAADYAIDHYLRPQNPALARKALREGVGSRVWEQAARQGLILMYASREVWHVQAASDVEGSYHSHCPTALQGRSRFERFGNFQAAWVQILGLPTNLHFVALENASSPHSSRAVYASEAGRHLLFY